MSEQLNFKADINELMNLIINAFYSNRDVFLREVISNSSDAIDKQRMDDLKSNRVGKEYGIRIRTDSENKTLTIEDDGIGMNRQELIDHLSTIARSGTKEFVKSLQEKSDQIGQFGVGFYSVFLVADRARVITKKYDQDTIFKWESDANQYYTIDSLSSEDASEFKNGHGTKLVLYMKEDASEYLEESVIRRIISTYSSFITYDIKIFTTKEIDVPIEEEETTTDDDKVIVEDEKEDDKPKTRKETVQEWETINGDRPIWYSSPSDVSEEEYKTLYKNISKDYEEPLHWKHFQTEGAFEFKGILYLPKKAPFDIMTERSKEKRRIRLYVKKVLVLDELDKEMMPDWMNFVVGVIDSADLPLNVSREMLQQTKVLHAMKTQLKKQVMTMLQDLVNDDEKYNTFYDAFQRNIKLGIHEGSDDLLSFLRIGSSGSEKAISLQEYTENYLKDEDQKCIYYITGTECKENPMVNLYKSKGYNVLFFNEAIDEFMLQRVSKYKDFDMINIIKEHDAPWKTDETETDNTAFCEYIKKQIDDSSLETIRISKTLTEPDQDPGFLFSSKFGWTGNMEKIMSSQPLNDSKSMFWMKGRKVLELNMSHPLISSFKSNFDSDNEYSSDTDRIRLFFRCCMLSAGFPIENQSEFVKSLFSTLTSTVATV